MFLFIGERKYSVHTGLERACLPCRTLCVQMGALWQTAWLAHRVAFMPKLSCVDGVLELISFALCTVNAFHFAVQYILIFLLLVSNPGLYVSI